MLVCVAGSTSWTGPLLRFSGFLSHTAMNSSRGQIQLLVFDMDRVLFDVRPYWLDALNQVARSVAAGCEVTPDQYENVYDGLSFESQLSILSSAHQLHFSERPVLTARFYDHLSSTLASVTPDPSLPALFGELKRRGFVMYTHSALPFRLAKDVLSALGLLGFFDWVVTADDVRNPLPHPETFYLALIRFGGSASHALAIEDHPYSREAAAVAGFHLLTVSTPAELTLDRVSGALEQLAHYAEAQTLSRLNAKLALQVLIPIAKPTAPGEVPSFWRSVAGRPLIECVLENLSFRGKFIFVVLAEHNARYNLSERLPAMASQYGAADVVVLREPSQGAACTCLAAEHLIDRNSPLVIANGDQYMIWDPAAFLEAGSMPGVVAAVSSFEVQGAAEKGGFSYLEVEDAPDTAVAASPSSAPRPTSGTSRGGAVTRIVGVRDTPQDDGTGVAVSGVFMWRSAGRFIDDAKATIDANITTRGLYFIHNVLQVSLQKEAEVPERERGWFASPRIEQSVTAPGDVVSSLTRMREIAASIGLPRAGPLVKLWGDVVTPAHGSSARV